MRASKTSVSGQQIAIITTRENKGRKEGGTDEKPGRKKRKLRKKRKRDTEEKRKEKKKKREEGDELDSLHVVLG